MPFVIRKVEPRLLCRGHVPPGRLPGAGAELDSVANGALTGCLKQLASVLTLAEDIFAELTSELTIIADRSGALRIRVDNVDERLAKIDPKKIPVPESDISTFASRKEHFHAKEDIRRTLFTAETRPKILRELYEAAAVVAVRSLDSISRDDNTANTGRNNSTEIYMCTPVLGKRRHADHTLDIESRVPAVIEDLRRWTSTEALGDVTVPPDCMSRILADTTDGDAVDHKLPSPEEQVQAVALKFPAEVVAVDISGRGFERMSIRRRSLLSPAGQQEQQEIAVKRRSRPRRPRGKRRNTIAGIDQKEIRQAIGGENIAEDLEGEEISASASSPRAHRSASTDILGSAKKDSPSEKKSHFNTLKAWGMSRLKLISPKSNQGGLQDSASLPNHNGDELAGEKDNPTPEDNNIYETVTMRRRKEKFHERKPSSSSSSGKSTSSIPVTIPITERQANVKLRESAAQRRERRKGNREDAPHSSSGNWSASSESGRASIGSETTTTTHPPRSTTTASIGTSSTSLSHVRRPKGRDMSASSSVTSEGTLTPDIIHDITAVPFSDDGENSSVYSCDTEGYYTSFHVDSGLKTLREEETLPQSPLTKSSDLGPDPASPMAENEYELFGRGSTSTTTSSAGTVCTTLLAPLPPERKSSLTVVAMVHGQNKNGVESPDSGHNTSSSPVESASSPACTGRSCSEFEYSESSDLEGCERVERIRSKTAINASRIPSMCVITPPGSDDETSKDTDNFRNRIELRNELGNLNPGSILMSATVGTSKMEVIKGEDKNPYATVQTVLPQQQQQQQQDDKTTTVDNNRRNNSSAIISSKVSPLSGVLGKLRCVLPGGGKKISTNKNNANLLDNQNQDSGDYVTIADVRNNNNKRSDHRSTSSTSNPSSAAVNPQRLNQQATYANSDLFKQDAEYVSLSELPKKQDSSLERRRQGARVTLDSEGKVVYSSDSLKRRKGAHTTFNPGPFVKEGISPTASPLLHRAAATVRAVNRDHGRNRDTVDSPVISTPPTSPQLGKLIIRATKSPERATSPNYVRTPSTVVGPTSPKSPTSPQKLCRGAYVNVQGEEDSALLAVPKESVSQDASCQQQHQKQQQQLPPPYVEPPQPKNREDINKTLKSNSNLQSYVKSRQHQQQQQQHLVYQNESSNCINQQHNNNQGSIRVGGGNNYEKRIEYKENRQDIIPNHLYSEEIYNGRQILRPCSKNEEIFSDRGNHGDNYSRNNRNLNNDYQQFYSQQKKSSANNSAQQFYTLPSYRTQREIEPPRSVTPDITRGLARGPLSSIHMLARRGKNIGHDQTGNKFTSDENLGSKNISRNVTSENSERRDQRQMQNQEQTSSSVLRNRFIVPTSLAAVGYRFVAAPSGYSLQDWKSPVSGSNALKHTSLSPIAPSSNKGFQSSTPGGLIKSAPTHSANNQESSSGRNTPTSLILSPTKSTMSNEELFAAIHKSKRKLNIREDTASEKIQSLEQDKVSTRHSWSPESQKTPTVPKSVSPLSTTSRLDFKRLLLQQSVKTGPTKLSAAEQLKLSRQSSLQQQQQLAINQQQLQIPQPVTPVKVLSPRAAWRFQSPRSDVLSSTIIEDAAAEEKAMKPSPENPSPISRINSKRQLDLCSDLPDQNKIRSTTFGEKINVPNNSSINDYRNNLTGNKIPSNINKVSGNYNYCEKRTNIIQETDGRRYSGNEFSNDLDKTVFNISKHDHILSNSAAENRRINNQLARAQFLASIPNAAGISGSSFSSSSRENKASYFIRHNRARSESPQHGITQNVTRSPSAPTLETAL